MYLVLEDSNVLRPIELLPTVWPPTFEATSDGHDFASIISPITQRALYIPSSLNRKNLSTSHAVFPPQYSQTYPELQVSNGRNETKTQPKYKQPLIFPAIFITQNHHPPKT